MKAKSGYKFQTRLFRVIVYTILTIAVLLTIVPIWMLLVNSTRSTTEIQQGISMIPSSHLLDNYGLLKGRGLNLFQGFVNSTFLAVSSTLLSVYFGFLTAYGIVAYDFKGRKLLRGFIVLLMLIPGQLTIVGFYQYMSRLGLTDSYIPLVLPAIGAVGSVYFAVQYLEAIFIRDLVAAGRVDGAGELKIFHQIMMPIAVPGAVTLGIFAFVGSWNNFFTPFILLSSVEKYTLPMLVQLMQGDVYSTEYGAIYLGIAITIIPVVIVFLTFSRYIVSGIAMGSVKE